MGLETLDSLLLLLLAQNDEWSTVFVECKTHFVVVSTRKSEAMLISLCGIRVESHTFRRLSCLVFCLSVIWGTLLTFDLKGGILIITAQLHPDARI